MNKRPVTAIVFDVIIIVITLLFLILLLTGPLLSNFGSSRSGFDAIGSIFSSNILAGAIFLLVLLLFIAQIFLAIARLLNVNFVQINKENSPLSTLIALLRLSDSTTDSDTGRLGLILAVGIGVLMLLLSFFDYGIYSLSGIGAIGVVISVPLGIFSALQMPQVRRRFNVEVESSFESTGYIEVMQGSLAGAQPRIRPDRPLYICDNTFQALQFYDPNVKEDYLLLYDEMLNGLYISLYLEASQFWLFSNQPLQLNQSFIAANTRYALKRGDAFWVGRTQIIFQQ